MGNKGRGRPAIGHSEGLRCQADISPRALLMRIIAIIGALVLGLIGLFMSVCGGGVMLSMGRDTWHNFFGAHHDPNAINGLFLMLLPAGFLALGIVVSRSAYRTLRKNFKHD